MTQQLQRQTEPKNHRQVCVHHIVPNAPLVGHMEAGGDCRQIQKLFQKKQSEMTLSSFIQTLWEDRVFKVVEHNPTHLNHMGQAQAGIGRAP